MRRKSVVHMQSKQLATWFIMLIITCTLASQVEAEAKIIYIPLDNRPVCLDYVKDTAAKAGYNLTIPPVKLLSNHKNNSNIKELWKWLEKEAPTARAAVIATDTLTYGGLVASRKHEHTARFLAEKNYVSTIVKSPKPLY